ncbi:MAG: LysR substrate-binding domain-containing protein, partial [Noviherbaspirillum sp.]
QQEQLIARYVGQIELGLHATRQYIERHGNPGSVEELAGHTLIGFDQATAFIRSAAKSMPGFDREIFSVRTDNDIAQLALIRAGVGIGICQAVLANRSDTLVRVLPNHFSLKLDTWIAMHEDLRNSPRCRRTFDALVAGLQRHAT